jgi:hypothetical protein
MSDTPRLDETAQDQEKKEAADTATPAGVSEHLVKMVATPMVPARHT